MELRRSLKKGQGLDAKRPSHILVAHKAKFKGGPGIRALGGWTLSRICSPACMVHACVSTPCESTLDTATSDKRGTRRTQVNIGDRSHTLAREREHTTQDTREIFDKNNHKVPLAVSGGKIARTCEPLHGTP